MNQLEFFVASTEATRSDVVRFLRQLRDLDGLIEYHLGCLSIISNARGCYLVSTETTSSSKGRGCGSRSRGRGAATPSIVVMKPGLFNEDDDGDGQGRSARGAAMNAHARHEEQIGDAEKEWIASVTKASQEELHVMFEHHRTLALRHSREREALAQELAARGADMQTCISSRLAQFEPLLE